MKLVSYQEGGPNSDVDLLAEFDPAMRQTLVTVGSPQSRLSEILNVRADLSSSE
ncbi:MAG TPA: hypothetical protein VMD25_07605 [Acidobacteriaceae bacterium]|nr:hypothetical protein [Acidobacteriaceae bacterium]